jgi:type I restriction enzyme S subunit
MSLLRKVKIKDLGKVFTGSTPPTKDEKMWGGKHLFVKPSDLIKGSRKVLDTESKLTDAATQTSKGRLLPVGTTCVVTIGTIGKLCQLDKPSATNQQINSIVVDKDKFDEDYIYYLMSQSIDRVKVVEGGSASGREHVKKSTFEEIELEVLPLSEQIKVANLVSNYDNLIENNNRRIAILEDMAQSLYREWFVNFRYPGHADAVDKDGNQILINSPLGQIPEGWEVGELKEFCSKIGSGATPRGGKGAYKNEGVPLIRSMNIYDSTLITKNLAFIDDVQAARLKNVVVEPDDVLLNITGASVARCSIVPSAFTPARVNQHVAIIRLKTNQLSSEYLMYTLISANGKARLLSTAQGGATREALTKTDIEKFKVVVPPRDIINKFNLLAQVAVKQKEVLFLKNENLKQQRDMLLPKLISGTIEL